MGLEELDGGLKGELILELYGKVGLTIGAPDGGLGDDGQGACEADDDEQLEQCEGGCGAPGRSRQRPWFRHLCHPPRRLTGPAAACGAAATVLYGVFHKLRWIFRLLFMEEVRHSVSAC